MPPVTLHINEPMTVFTNIVMAIFCIICYHILSTKRQYNYLTDWRFFYLFIGISAFIGIFNHGLTWSHSSIYYKISWLISQAAIGISIFYAQMAAINEELSNPSRRELFRKICILQLALFLVAVFYSQNFIVVSINSFIGLVQLLIIYYPGSGFNRNYKTLIFSGFFISFLTVYIHSQKVVLGEWFNHNDIAHTIMLMSLFLIFTGLKYKYSELIVSNPAVRE